MYICIFLALLSYLFGLIALSFPESCKYVYVCMLCIYFWGNFGRGRFLSFTLIFKIYARTSSKSQSKQNKCRATEIISLESQLSTLDSPKTQAQAQAQPETEGDLALLAKSGHAWSVAKECATFRVFAESSRATWMCRGSRCRRWKEGKEISQEPADLVELGQNWRPNGSTFCHRNVRGSHAPKLELKLVVPLSSLHCKKTDVTFYIKYIYVYICICMNVLNA